MKKFLLVCLGPKETLWIFGQIEAVDAASAATVISSKVVQSSRYGALNTRHLLEETAKSGGTHVWFLEEAEEQINSRPGLMDLIAQAAEADIPKPA